MTFQPIDMRPDAVRAFIQSGPDIQIAPLMALAGDVAGSSHVSVNKGLTLAIELLGLARVHELMRRDRNVVLSWIALIEDFGWSDDPGNAHRNLQMTLLVNGIKNVIRKENTGDRLKAQEIATGMAQVLALGRDKEFDVIDHLFLRNNYDVPWAIWA